MAGPPTDKVRGLLIYDLLDKASHYPIIYAEFLALDLASTLELMSRTIKIYPMRIGIVEPSLGGLDALIRKGDAVL